MCQSFIGLRCCGVINVFEIYLQETLHLKARKKPRHHLSLLEKPRNYKQSKWEGEKCMKIFHYDTVKAKEANDGASKVTVRWLITKEMGAENFAMRLFEIASGGYSPLHAHSWEHEVFILDGEGTVFDGEKATAVKAGDVVFVPTDERHQFRNNGKKPLKFLCLIPYSKE
jgi:quercetin dioxygenase-like cupin family protein